MMKRKSILLILALSTIVSAYSQKAVMEITFTATDNGVHVPLDSIRITNLTSGGDTLLIGSDTILHLDYTTSINENMNVKGFKLSQNCPNPFQDMTSFDVFIPEYGKLIFEVFELSGKRVVKFSGNYPSGGHKFSFIAANGGFYVLKVTFNDESHSMKMYCLDDNVNSHYGVSHIGTETNILSLKITNAIKSLNFVYGDSLQFIGYNQNMGVVQVYQATQNANIVFNYACPPTFIDSRDGNVYPSVQIGTQCWMGKNLAFLPSVNSTVQSSDTIPHYYVYYYNDTIVFLAKASSYYKTYGVLYNRPAAMNGQAYSDSVPSGVQGICPAGWHLPSDEEWKILEGEVDSVYGYPDSEWNNLSPALRGVDAGGNMKETGTVHWSAPNSGATNSSGLKVLGSGRRNSTGGFSSLKYTAYFWTSTDYPSNGGYIRWIDYDNAGIGRGSSWVDYLGYSVRCIRN